MRTEVRRGKWAAVWQMSTCLVLLAMVSRLATAQTTYPSAAQITDRDAAWSD